MAKKKFKLCPSLEKYSKKEIIKNFVDNKGKDILVSEYFAGVGGFRIGLERASARFKTIFSNQWEPSTKKRQDAAEIYVKQFGEEGFSNCDINDVVTNHFDIVPQVNLLCGGFPCQDYSVAATLKTSKGIKGKKGVLWWDIYNSLVKYGDDRPGYLLFENVDRLIKSPASQRGRDFAIILASLNNLGYTVEWRVINAADYGMPQRRRRTYILGYLATEPIQKKIEDVGEEDWLLSYGTMAEAFPLLKDTVTHKTNFKLEKDLNFITKNFNVPEDKDKEKKPLSPFHEIGIMRNGKVLTFSADAKYDGLRLCLKDIMLDDSEIPEEFFINEEDLPRWEYLKGSKRELRTNKETGFQYKYSEGSMAFPDDINMPSRTIITGEGGPGPSRFKHVVRTKDGRLRRLTPIELERLNMFPDNHTEGSSNMRRAFLMGNALVTGIIEKIGISLIETAEI